MFISSSFSFFGINYFNGHVSVIAIFIILIIIINLFQFDLKITQSEKFQLPINANAKKNSKNQTKNLTKLPSTNKYNL